MVLTNAERQARYKQRLLDAARPAWIRKDFERAEDAIETAGWFREFFGRVPAPQGLRVLSRQKPGDSGMSLLVRMPWPLGEPDAGMMQGWRLAKEDAADLGHWHVLL